jgi:hypothetical protein
MSETRMSDAELAEHTKRSRIRGCGFLYPIMSPKRSKAMPTNWTDQVSNAIANLQTKIGRVLEPDQALAIIDEVVEGKLAAYELAMIHGIPEAWIEVTLGHVTRTSQGAGRVLPLDVGGWYAFQGHERSYELASGFAAARKKARDLA